MKLRTALAALVTLVVAAATASSVVAAGGHSAHYLFRGHLLATPAAGAPSLSVNVEGGNRLALRKMLGAPVAQTFAVGATTQYLRWSDGVPTVVAVTDLQAGDIVSVHVRAPRSATLAELEATPAATVGDRGSTPARPAKPLFLFRGTLAAPVGPSSLTLHLTGGNRRALRVLLGQPADQTFRVDATTIFLVWRGRVPSVISAGQLAVGERVTVRIRADRGSTLAQLEATPAAHVAEHQRTA